MLTTNLLLRAQENYLAFEKRTAVGNLNVPASFLKSLLKELSSVTEVLPWVAQPVCATGWKGEGPRNIASEDPGRFVA
jgi:hypothetical protein